MICPHLLRYLTLAVIANTGKRNTSDIRELVQVLRQEQNAYQDPITDFLKCLYVDFDFDTAQQKLQVCKEVLSGDYFLENKQDEFLESARLFIFETYCRIHQCIDIKFVSFSFFCHLDIFPNFFYSMLADKLAMDKDQAELWIVNLIRNAKLDAKIDLANGKVIMGNKRPTVYVLHFYQLLFYSHSSKMKIDTNKFWKKPKTFTSKVINSLLFFFKSKMLFF